MPLPELPDLLIERRQSALFVTLNRPQVKNALNGAIVDGLFRITDHLQGLDMSLKLELIEKRPEAALRIAQQIREKHPNSPVGFEREADILFFLRRYPEAIEPYEQALARGVGSTGLIKLHQTLHLAGQKKIAETLLNDWLTRHPNDTVVRSYAASLLMKQGRNAEAIKAYEEIVRLGPSNHQALNNLAVLYQRERDKRALMTAEQALKLSPEHPGIQDTLGWILVEQGQTARGFALLSKAVSGASDNPSIRYHYAVALARTGQTALAKSELERVLAEARDFPERGAAEIMLKQMGKKPKTSDG